VQRWPTMTGTLAIRKAGLEFQVADRAEYRDFWNVYQTEAWEPDTVAVFARFLRPGTRYVDLGAWIGPTILLAAPSVSRVACVEPDPVAFAALSENLALNPDTAGKTITVAAAVGPHDGYTVLTSAGNGGDSNSSIARPGDTGARWQVEQVSFSTLLARAALDTADFVKMDIEGAEYDLVPAMIGRPTLYIAFHPNLLVDKRSLRARLSSSLRALWSNHRLLRALMPYRHHYVYDVEGESFRDIRNRNRLRILFPLPLRSSFLIGSCLFSNEDDG
jgi:FkbM family methyltransferase